MYKDELNIVAADETACWFDMALSKTVEQKGSKTVKVKTTGHEKSRYYELFLGVLLQSKLYKALC